MIQVIERLSAQLQPDTLAQRKFFMAASMLNSPMPRRKLRGELPNVVIALNVTAAGSK
jgi:hypothetical protein